jgi:hypothetical protein
MAYIYNMADTWADAGTTFTAIKMNVTDTASNAASLLMDLQVGGASQFRVTKAGVAVAGFGAAGGVISGFGQSNGAAIGYWNGSAGVHLGVSAGIYWGTGGPNSQALDLSLFRDAANILAQRNGTNAQTFRVYNTFTDASNYERGVFDWATQPNSLTIGTQQAGSGAARSLRLTTQGNANLLFITNSVTRFDISSLGLRATENLIWTADNTYDIGASGATRPRSIYAAADILAQNNTSGFYLGASSDVAILRDEANALALRRTTNPQTFRVYNTSTDASNYERGKFAWASNVLQIGTEKAGTGTARALDFQTDGATRFSVSATLREIIFNGDGRISRQTGFGGIVFDSGNNITVGVSSAAITCEGYLQMPEQTAPAAPAANRVRIYAEDNGSGKTRLMALFATGAAVQIAIEP